MIYYKTNEEVEIMRESALMVSATLTEVARVIRAGIKTIELDRLAETYIRDNGGVPSFKGYGMPGNQFPYSLCISVNDIVVHGFPGDYELKDGDIVSVDCGVFKNGFHGDHAYTFAIGNVRPEVLELVRITKESLYKGIEQAVVGNRIGDISAAIEEHTFGKHGYGVVRELVGHGLGREMHEEPQIPNYGRRGGGKRLKENLVLAIEPMINLGTRYVYTAEDGWNVLTEDGLPSVHFEHDVCVKKGKADILSDYTNIEAAEAANPDLAVSGSVFGNVG
ncbi:MAG TPA: type I methionyl aminopeptidase [Edaphocola sp.]|nr:type I methionyl aminopeptidase [Edaphocola sp.]